VAGDVYKQAEFFGLRPLVRPLGLGELATTRSETSNPSDGTLGALSGAFGNICDGACVANASSIVRSALILRAHSTGSPRAFRCVVIWRVMRLTAVQAPVDGELH
jgi:hypothetical protein